MQFDLSILLLSLLCLSKCCFLYVAFADEPTRPEEKRDDELYNDAIISHYQNLLASKEAEFDSSREISPTDISPTNAGSTDISSADANGEPQTYGVIVDCGSSGTRVHIYQWDTKLVHLELWGKISPMRNETTNKPLSEKFTPGLSSLADKTIEDVHAYIKPVADYVNEMIPSDRHPFTVIYILATAGMRLLGKDNQDWIMTQVRQYVMSNYKFRDVKPSVISGSDEGMYQWISVNAKSERFLGENTNEKTKTYGIIEMGGASVQVTFHLMKGEKPLVLSSMKRNIRNIYEAQLVEPLLSRRQDAQSTFLLHSTTFLGFGSNSAYEAYLDLLIKNHFSKDFLLHWYFNKTKKWLKMIIREKDAWHEDGLPVMKDPCSPKGYHKHIEKPTRMLDSKRSIGFIVVDNEPTFELKVVGTGRYGRCKRLMEDLLKLAKEEELNCKEDELCTMSLVGEEFVPFENMDFLGIGDIYYTSRPLLGKDNFYRRKAIIRKTRDLCATPYHELERNALNKKQSTERLHIDCFKSVWMDTLLTKGLLMPNNYNMLRTVGQIRGEPPEWSLGAVLEKSLTFGRATDGSNKDIVDKDSVEKSTDPTEEEATEVATAFPAPTAY